MRRHRRPRPLQLLRRSLKILKMILPQLILVVENRVTVSTHRVLPFPDREDRMLLRKLELILFESLGIQVEVDATTQNSSQAPQQL